MHIRMRQRVSALVAGDQIMVVMRNRALKFADLPHIRWVLARLAEGTDPEIVPSMAVEHGVSVTDDTVRSLINSLDAINALERLDIQHDLPSASLERHARSLEYLSPMEGEDGSRYDMHSRVARSSVLLIGAGGLGSWVAYGLAAAGVGRLGLCDPDTVNLSNLNRSILFDRDTVGKFKVDAARDRLSRFAPDLVIDTFTETVTGSEDVARLAETFDLIIGVADQPHRKIRRWVASGSTVSGVPSLQAGGGRIGPLYLPGKTSCAGCLQASLAPPGSELELLAEQPGIIPFRSPGSLAPFPAAESGMIVLEAYRYLSKMAEPATINAYIAQGPNLFDGKVVTLPPHLDCAVCGA